MSRARGFTLLELLVAVFIAALMAAMGYAAISQVARQRGSVQAEQRSIDALSRAMRVMTLDFAQTAARPVRDALGRGMESAVLADPRISQGVSLTRAHTLEVARLVTDWHGQGPIDVPGARVERKGDFLHIRKTLPEK